MFEIKEIQAKSILVPSKLPDTDFVINPYTGCRFGCVYCYASFMSRYIGKDISSWGEFVYVKVNAPELLKKRLETGRNLSLQKWRGKTIFLSSVTDPYQGVEAKYKLTRQCLQILLDYNFQGKISILTKSDLVLRDINIISQLKNIEVGLTITSISDTVSRYFEKFAPPVSKRLKALKILNRKGIKTYAFVGPLLPHFVTQEKKLGKVFQFIKDTGTNELYIEHINLSNYILGRLKREVSGIDSDIMEKFYQSKDESYREELNKILIKLVKKYGFTLRNGDVIYHGDWKKGI